MGTETRQIGQKWKMNEIVEKNASKMFHFGYSRFLVQNQHNTIMVKTKCKNWFTERTLWGQVRKLGVKNGQLRNEMEFWC